MTAINTSGGNPGALAYDNADQLSTDTITNSGTQVQKYTYAYDAKGNRVSLERLSVELQERERSRPSIRSYLSGVNHFLRWAAREGELPAPAAGSDRVTLKRTRAGPTS